MKIKLGFLMIALSSAAFAQSSSGYVFFAPGGVSSSGFTSASIHAGGGADLHIAKGIGANIEIGSPPPRRPASSSACSRRE